MKKIWSNLKTWQKGAILGGIWGVGSGIVWLIMSMGAQPPSLFDKIIFIPGYSSFIFFGIVSGILKERIYAIPEFIGFFLIAALPLIIGSLIGMLIFSAIKFLRGHRR